MSKPHGSGEYAGGAGPVPHQPDRFRQIADAAPVPMWLIGRDGKREFVNQAFVDFTGLDYDAALGVDWRPLIHPDDYDRLTAEVAKGQASGQPFSVAGRYRRGDGAWRWLHIVLKPNVDEAGQPDGFCGVTLDMTDAKEAEIALREREAQLSAFISQTTAGFAQVDTSGRFTLVNDRYCEIVGYSAEQLYGMTMQQITHPDDLPRNQPLFDAAVREGAPYIHEKRYIRGDGEIVWVHNSVAVIRRDGGEPYGILAITMDVTERRRADEALRRSAESLRLAIEGAGMATWEIELDSMAGPWSPNRFDIFGLPRRPDLRGTFDDWLGRIHPEDLGYARSAAERCFHSGQSFQIEYRIIRADNGEIRWLQSNGSLIGGGSDAAPRFVGVSFDITDRKQAEVHQQLLINELNHRVKNSLAIVQAISQQTFTPVRSGANPSAAVSAFQGRLAALSAAHNLLTRESWTPAPLGELLRDAIAPHAEPGRCRLEGPDLTIQPKTGITLALAVHELATNAVKHGALSAARGSVDIGWRIEAGTPARLHLKWTETGGPPVTAPATRGFGTRMIERGLAAELGGTVKMDFHPAGLVCTVDAPLPDAA